MTENIVDITSLLLGFLVGTATGAAGTYFADKYTDQRRRKQQHKDEIQLWRDIEQRHPAIVAEMRSDFCEPKNRHTRAFFVKTSKSSISSRSEPSFEYHTDVHDDLRAAMLILEQYGFISDITKGNCPTYRIHEKLVDALLKT